jgi:protein TonB
MNFASAAPALSQNGSSPAPAPPPRMDRRLYTVLAVIGLHVLGLWALQSGLLRRAVELVVPITVMVESINPPAPAPLAPPVHTAKPLPQRAPAPKPVQRALPTPQPLAIADNKPTPAAVEIRPTPAPEPAPVAAAAPSAPPAPPAPPRVELPSSSADYLNNPAPAYPAISKRLGEQGKVMVRAYIDANGAPGQAQIARSSGYERLDQAALQAVLKWRFVPGRRNGVAEAMWLNLPIQFSLD